MKKFILTLNICLAFSIVQAQIKKTIAVSNPKISGLNTTPEVAAKLITIELIKLNTYSVMDEFELESVYSKNTAFKNCYTKECLVALGEALSSDYTVTGSIDQLGSKIIISLKFIDVKAGIIHLSSVKEFDDQEIELQRMIELLLKEMHGLEVPKELNDRLTFKNEVITSNNVGKINNSGPRIGYAYLTGSLNEFAGRSMSQGGLDIFPAISMIGYQLEGQYVGTENFSALVEGLINISGLEQGQFIPSLSVLNGFRFGKAGWEIAFGPSFSVKQLSTGFFDSNGKLGRVGDYYSIDDFNSFTSKNFPESTNLEPQDFDPNYNFDSKYPDTRGASYLSTSFIFAFGRTFRSGALNIPVNVFYSSQRKGGMVGVSVGFNVMKSKKPINSRRY
jgi:hypothetical protein